MKMRSNGRMQIQLATKAEQGQTIHPKNVKKQFGHCLLLDGTSAIITPVFKIKNVQVGLGWIVRDNYGHFVTAASSYLPKSTSALEAESFSLLHALQTLWSRGFKWVIMKGDCQQLVDLING